MKVIHLVRFTSFTVFLFGLVCLPQDAAVAESTNFIVNNTTTVLELTVPSVATINLNPTSGTGFDTAEVVVESGTNNSTGYVLTMSVPNTNLTNSGVTLSNPTVPVDASNHPIIPTLASGSYSVSDFTTNAWGYKLGSASNYSPVPSSVELVNTNSAANASAVTLNFAAKVDTSRYTGTYSTAINFTAVTKAPPVYTFDDAYSLANKTKYNGYYTMQDGNSAICSLVTTGQTGTLIDRRDDETYLVAKALDGNCWMIQNLKLGKTTTSLNLTNAQSDTDANGFTLNGKLSDGVFTPSYDGVNLNESSQYYCTNDYGCYYNWYTATAGSGAAAVELGDVDYSICPKGWTLPTGGSDGQLATLYSYYNSAALMLVDNPTTTTENTAGKVPGFLLAGFYSGVDGFGFGEYGMYWSRTADGWGTAYVMFSTYSSVDFSMRSSPPRYAGVSVRCLLQ